MRLDASHPAADAYNKSYFSTLNGNDVRNYGTVSLSPAMQQHSVAAGRGRREDFGQH